MVSLRKYIYHKYWQSCNDPDYIRLSDILYTFYVDKCIKNSEMHYGFNVLVIPVVVMVAVVVIVFIILLNLVPWLGIQIKKSVLEM